MLLESVQIKIEDPYLNEIGGLPKRGTPGSAGYDVRACIKEKLVLRPGEVRKVPTGFAIYIKDPNWSLVFLPRSGLGSRGLVLANTVGLIDSDFQRGTEIALWNRNASEEFAINPGDRVAQMVFLPVGHPEFNIVDEFDDETDRGLGGFGSTGIS